MSYKGLKHKPKKFMYFNNKKYEWVDLLKTKKDALLAAKNRRKNKQLVVIVPIMNVYGTKMYRTYVRSK